MTHFTVAELINYLSQFDPDAPVVISMDDTDDETAVSIATAFDVIEGN